MIVPSRTELGIAALGGASVGPTASVTGSGQATVSLALGRAGLSLDVGLASARTRAVDGVSVESASQWASLSAVIFFHPLERLRLALSLGPRVWRLSATTTGAAENGSLALASFGGVGAANATVRLVGPLSLVVQLFVSARWRAERFTVTNLGPVLELLPWEGGALGGLQLDASL